jgi:hypothetical protein
MRSKRRKKYYNKENNDERESVSQGEKKLTLLKEYNKST